MGQIVLGDLKTAVSVVKGPFTIAEEDAAGDEICEVDDFGWI